MGNGEGEGEEGEGEEEDGEDDDFWVLDVDALGWVCMWVCIYICLGTEIYRIKSVRNLYVHCTTVQLTGLVQTTMDAPPC